MWSYLRASCSLLSSELHDRGPGFPLNRNARAVFATLLIFFLLTGGVRIREEKGVESKREGGERREWLIDDRRKKG